jgi:hypothetical protein
MSGEAFMSIEQTDIVDIISIDGNTCSVVLTVNDPLDWSNRMVMPDPGDVLRSPASIWFYRQASPYH